jgi:ELWxxDGT repeat protein
MKPTLLTILILFAVTISTFAQLVSLVKNINNSTNNYGSYPANITVLGSSVVFTASDPLTGNEIWVSNGTSGGTTRLKDIWPGGNGSSPSNLTKVGSYVYFSANDGTNGTELWRTDGTAVGTVLVKDINAGGGNSYPSGFTPFNGSIYFQAYTNANGYELWKTDGTAVGTVLVSDIQSGTSSSSPSNFTAIGTSYLVFSAFTTAAGQEFYSYDGTTITSKDIFAGSSGSYPSNFVYNSNIGKVGFTAYNGSSYSFYTTIGTTAGVAVVTGGYTYAANLASSGSYFYFEGNDATAGYEVWSSSNGTSASRISDIVAGTGSSYPGNFIPSGSAIYFTAYNGSGYPMYYSTGASVSLVSGAYSNPGNITTYGNPAVVFEAYDATSGYEVWKTTSGAPTTATKLTTEINPGTGSSYPGNFTFAGSVIYFSADNGVNGYELWTTDLSTNTILVKDINTAADSNITIQTPNSGGFLMSAYDGSSQEVWKTDITSAGTIKLTNINPGSYAYPAFLGKAGSNYLYNAYNPTYGYELWKTDGATYVSSPTVVADINAGASSSSPSGGVAMGSFVYFTAYDATNGYELRKSDGTTTSLVKDIYPGTNSSYPGNLTVIGSTLYFSANDGTNGIELWKSDGTSAGTTMLKNISLSDNSYPSFLTAVGTTLYFNATDGLNGYELWKSDGTSAGTILVKDINGSGDSYPQYLTSYNSTICFIANDGTNGNELWKSDGTSAGTVLVKDIEPGSGSSYPNYLIVANSTLYFTASTSTNGNEVWKSDGTTGGTTLLKDLASGASSSNPSNLSSINGTIYFNATDGVSGNLLYKTNGSSAGTIKATSSGEAYDYPGYTYYYNGKLIFNANTNSYGNEPLTLMAEPLNQPTVLNFTGKTATSISGSFTAAAGSPSAPSGYIVLRKTGSAPPDLPVDGAAYSVGATIGTSTVAATGSSVTFTDNFTASASPPTYYYAVFSYNNDGTANIYQPYSPLQGNSTPLAAEPTAQPTGLSSSTLTTTSFTVSFTAAANAPSGYLALVKTGSTAPTDVPVDGTAYSTGNTIGSSKVAYVGSSTSFPQISLAVGQAYSYTIYSYNGSTGTFNYLTSTTGLSGTISTLVAEPTAQPTSLLFSGNTVNSISGSFAAASPVPGGYIVVRNTTSSVDAPVDGSTYIAGNAVGSSIVVYSGTGTTFNDTGLTAGTTYYYAIFSFNGSASTNNYLTTSPLSSSSSTLSLEPADQPVSFNYSSVTSTSYTVSFTAAASSPNGYIALRVTGAVPPTDVPVDGTGYSVGSTIGSSTVVAYGSGTSFSESGLTPNTQYSYAIFSGNGTGNVATNNYLISSPLTGTAATLALQPTAQPTNLILTGNTTTSIAGSFTAASPAPTGGYIVIRNTTSSVDAPLDGIAYTAGNTVGVSTIVYSGSGTTFSDTGLTPGTTYYYAVFSFNGSGGTNNYLIVSPLLSGSLASVPSAQPTGLSFSAVQASSISLAWTAATGSPDGYLVIRKSGSAPTGSPSNATVYPVGASIGDGTVTYSSSATAFTDNSLSAATKYYYQVFSFNGSGLSSSYLTTSPLGGNATTLDAEPVVQPTSLSFSSVGLTSLTGSFMASASPPVSGYVVIRNAASAPTGSPLDGTTYAVGVSLTNGTGTVAYVGSNNAFQESNLTAQTKYFYAVYAYNNAVGPINYLTVSPLTNNVTTLTTDTTPPVVTNTTAATIASGISTKITATIADPESGVTSVSLQYKSISGSDSYITTSMTLVSGSTTNWESPTIQSSEIGEIGLEFIIAATNGQGGVTISSSFNTVVAYADQTLPYTSFGSDQTSYRIISIPLNLSSNTVANVFADNLGAYDNTKWRIFHFQNGSNNELTSTSTIDMGKGYWFIAKTQATINTGAGNASGATPEQPFTINLTTGWNQIGNPYLFNLSWADVQAASQNTLNLRTYNGTWNDGTILHKFEGGFVLASQATTLTIPTKKNLQAQLGRLANSVVESKNSIDSPNWEVFLKLQNDNITYNLGGLGMSQNASDEFDQYDDFTLPRFADYLELNHQKSFLKIPYSKDIVPTSESHIWNFNVNSNLSGVTEIKWDNSYFGDNSKAIALLDEETKTIIDMRQKESYSINSASSHSFKVVFGNADFVRDNTLPDELTVNTVYPNPSSTSVTIGFTTPEYLGEAPVSVRAINLMGQPVSNVFSGNISDGYHEFLWNGKDETGARASQGIYLIEIRVNNQVKVSRVVLM